LPPDRDFIPGVFFLQRDFYRHVATAFVFAVSMGCNSLFRSNYLSCHSTILFQWGVAFLVHFSPYSELPVNENGSKNIVTLLYISLTK
jgi:hypothetical protein